MLNESKGIEICRSQTEKEELCFDCKSSDKIAEEKMRMKIYKCSVCGINEVFPADGIDTCNCCRER